MNVNFEPICEGYIVVYSPEGYRICHLKEMDVALETSAFDGSCTYWFSGKATYSITVNTARRTTPEEIVALIEEQEKRNERKRINDGADQD